MNLKELDKKWQESCPEEVNGLVKRKKGNRWNKIVKSAEARRKLKSLKDE